MQEASARRPVKEDETDLKISFYAIRISNITVQTAPLLGLGPRVNAS